MQNIKNSYLLSAGNTAIHGQCEAFRDISDRLSQLETAGDPRTAARAAALKSRLNGFAAKVIMVGQVKAGKTALTNVMAGQPGLLPSDVNPWTSVVTNIMMNGKTSTGQEGEEVKARFTFFNRNEWDNLMVGGGRLGELAERAGASEEAMEVQRQIELMRQKTETRLGRHFGLLLGQSHDYGYVDTELMERYVSLGDEDDMEDVSSKTGRFADITKSADLFLDVPEYEMPLHLCDTPGVNDTFMMREQITMRSLRGAELCVVVLSAHQALSTVDLALMRIIATMEKRQIILFVNRVDELRDPSSQIPEIRNGIVATLKANKVETDIPIIFGSAKWAETALVDDPDVLHSDSADTLAEYLPTLGHVDGEDEAQQIWRAAGMDELLTAISERIRDGSAQTMLDKVSRGMRNLVNEAKAVATADRKRAAEDQTVDLDGQDLVESVQKVADHFDAEMKTLCEGLHKDLLARLEKAQDGFVRRATDSLISHFERQGEQGKWQYDPAGLRVLQRSAYLGFSRNVTQKVGAMYLAVAQNIEAVYRSALGDDLKDFRLEAPQAPAVPPPVGLGKTIALDLQGNWWRRWWQRRRGFESSATEYAQLIRAETQSILNELDSSQVQPVLEECLKTYANFIAEHIETIKRLSGVEDDELRTEMITAAQGAQSAEVFDEILKGLEEQAA